MSFLVRTERRGNVALVTLINPPLNVLSAQMRRELLEALASARNTAPQAARSATGPIGVN